MIKNKGILIGGMLIMLSVCAVIVCHPTFRRGGAIDSTRKMADEVARRTAMLEQKVADLDSRVTALEERQTRATAAAAPRIDLSVRGTRDLPGGTRARF